jgi:polypyrimidine tract-binding protein 2
VLHVRGLPAYTTESELSLLCSPFGQVIKILLLSSKQQAFVQMESVEAATNLVTRFASSPAYIRTKPIHFQFSNRSEVKTNQSKSGGGGGGEGGSGDSQQTPNNILLVSVLNARVPVTLENIHQIFKPYGEV